MHSITTRIPTPDELKHIESTSAEGIISCGCGIILLVIIPSLAIGIFATVLRSIFYDDAIEMGLVSAGIFVSLLLTVFLFCYIPYEQRQRRIASEDIKARTIQDIHISAPRVIQIGLINDNEPILAFGIGNNKILFLQGQWLCNEGTYGVEPLSKEQSEDDALDEFLNGLPEPHSFPSTEFTVSRFPNSKKVIGIRVAGSYIAPEAEAEALEPEYEFGDSELFEGSLDNIADALAHEHRRRKKTRKAGGRRNES